MTEEAKRDLSLHREWMEARLGHDPDAHLDLMDEAWEALTDEERLYFSGESARIAKGLRSAMPEMVDVPDTERFPRRIK